jgi:hypothetical protein
LEPSSLKKIHTFDADTARITLVRQLESFEIMPGSKECFPEEEDLAPTNADLGTNPAPAHPVSHFIEHFAPPPKYSGGESYDMESFQPRATGISGATGNFGPSDAPRAVVGPGATGAPAAAPEEPFNFPFYAPRKSKKRYWIALFAILLLIIAGLTTLSGTLALKLSTQPKPQNITITKTEQLSTTVTSLQHTTVNMTLTSFISVTTTQQLSFTTTTILTTTLTPTRIFATKTELPVGKPIPKPTLDNSPHAICIASNHPGGGVDIRLWENYIMSQFQDLSLAAALDKRCGLNLPSTGWTITQSELWFPLPGNKEWVSTFEHTFVFANAALPDGLQCIQQAIIDAGGPADTPSCVYTLTSTSKLKL